MSTFCWIRILRPNVDIPLLGEVTHWLQAHRISYVLAHNCFKCIVLQLRESDALHFKIAFEFRLKAKEAWGEQNLDITTVDNPPPGVSKCYS